MVLDQIEGGKQKMLFETFYPDCWMDSTYEIDFDKLYQEGY